MLKTDLIWFLRPTIGILAAYLIAFTLAHWFGAQHESKSDNDIAILEGVVDELETAKFPSDGLSAKQVVEIQTAALRDKDRRRGAYQCMCFASPSNLRITGPFAKFAKLIRGPKFVALSEPSAIMIGDPMYANDHARVLVTTVANEKLHAFVWVLSKQSEKYKDCWMTEGVFPMLERESDLEI